MNEERMKQLRRVVEAAPDDRLHMRAWCEEATCGTAYCAAGWAAIDPWFRAHTEIGTIFVVKDATVRLFHALARLFDINVVDAFRLFVSIPVSDDPHYVTKAMVLKNIDRVLAGLPASGYSAMKKEERPPCTKDA